MATVRRYGPSMVAPEVTPTPALGRGSQQVFETIEAGFNKVNQFIRPAVEQVQSSRAEQEALTELEDAGPDFQPVLKEGALGGLGGEQGAGGDAAGPVGKDQPPLQPGPTKVKAKGLPNKGGEGWDWRRSAAAIARVESDGSGGYSALGPPVKRKDGSTDRAYGKYQVMGANIPAWTKKHVGKAMTPAEFLKSEYAQDAVFRGEFGASVKKYGNEQDAASVWFSGRPMDRAGNSSDGYNTVPEYVAKFSNALGEVTQGGRMADYELKNMNSKTFEPRRPFTFKDAAFNASADRIIGARASEALETGLMLAQAKANGDLGILRDEMQKVRSEVMATLPKELPGLATDLEATFTRGMAVAERQAIELKERQVIAANTTAMAGQAAAVKAEVERLALTGAGSAAISAALASGQEALAAYGPREAFTVNGKEYPADPRRAGLMSANEIAGGVAELSGQSYRIMLEAEFQKSAAPGQFVEEFRKQVFSGNSPLGVGESLKLLSELQGRANSAESARRTAANAEKQRLETEYKDRINPYIEMTEQGVPIAIPQGERQRILTDLSPYPELQRQAAIEFEVADAAVATHGMRGAEIVAYADTVRADLAAAAEAGEIDLGAVAVLQSLEDQIKKAQDAVTAEMIGLPLIEQLALDGKSPDEINWDGLRDQAAGKQDLIDQINTTEAFYRETANMHGMSAQDREDTLEEARFRLADLAASGNGYGAAALMASKVIDKLTGWTEKIKGMAENDAMAFAKAKGVAMPGLDKAESMTDVGNVLAQRVGLLAPLTASEGVDHPVPLSQAEIDAISDVYRGSSRSQQTAFLGVISDLGPKQAEAIFKKIGQSEPTLFAAGTVYAGGNKAAASVILRGSVDAKVGGGTPTDVTLARTSAIGGLLESDLVDGASIPAIDAAALAYARGLALGDGGRDITVGDLEDGYAVAMGRQEDGSGGVQDTGFGPTVLPAGWTGRLFDRSIGKLDTPAMELLVGGKIQDATGRIYAADDFTFTIDQLRVDPEDPSVLIPLDSEGGVFFVDRNGRKDLLTIDLVNLKGMFE
jgi:hypothetical protein